MFRVLLPAFVTLVACTPSPQEAAMRRPSHHPRNVVTTGRSQDSAQDAKPAAGLAALRTDAAQAQGRRTLSTAFVMVGPDGFLKVELTDGRVMVLREVVMRREDYCGIQVTAGVPGGRYCGRYADVARARPGGGPTPGEPDPATLNPVGSLP